MTIVLENYGNAMIIIGFLFVYAVLFRISDLRSKILSLENASIEELYKQDEQTIAELRSQLSAIEQQTAEYCKYTALSPDITAELHALFPNITSVAIGQSIRNHTNGDPADTICHVRLNTTHKLSSADHQKISDWLQARLGTQQLEVIE